MKTKSDPRHQARIKLVRELFAYSFQSELPLSPPAQVLREATWEMLHAVPPVPPKVVIDEAIEISKTYASEKSPQFINGVLAAIAESQKLSLKTIS
jgi:N utilization substance protein B